MSDATASALYRRISRLRWQAPLLALLLVLVHQTVEHTWLQYLPRWRHFSSQVLFYGLVGPALAWWALSSLRRSVGETEKAEHALQDAHRRLQKVNRGLEFLIHVNRRLVEAEDEQELLDVIVTLPEQVLPVAAVSLVPLDEREQPSPPLFHGVLKEERIAAINRSLTGERVRQQCAACKTHTARALAPCALLSSVSDGALVDRVYCLPLSRGQRRYGLLNVFLDESQELTPNEQSLLRAMAHEISLALESQRLRTHELAMLVHLQQTNWWSDLEADLSSVLTRTVEVLEADGGAFWVEAPQPGARAVETTVGTSLGERASMVYSLAQSSRETGQVLDIRALEEEGSPLRSLLAVPLRAEGAALGSLVLWAGRPDAFGQRQRQLVSVVAGQATMLVENQRLSLQVEHQAALAERARLAREIHDGLAQTLGYLKLRSTQLIRHYDAGMMRDPRQDLEELRRLLDEAYVDAREAIDGLYLTSAAAGLEQWVAELAADFEQLSGVPVTVEGRPLNLPPEVKTQLQRIVQEALSNVRKHAAASHVTVSWWMEGETTLHFSICDDGCGFETADAPLTVTHGLRIMRERAELLEADLQVTSSPGEGTEIRMRLPVNPQTKEGAADVRND